jgi:DNA-binding LacI/PurR family transcriptional regulator
MKVVAAAAGVSKALVSLVFRDAPGASAATRAHVLAVAESIGYRPNRTASTLARRRSRHLGITLQLRNAFHAELVEDAQETASRMNYELMLSTITRSHDEWRAIETLLEYRCEAILLVGPESTPDELAELAARVPVVVLGRNVDIPGIDVVRTDEADGMAAVVDHLVALGHLRIVHVDGGGSEIAADRRRGYERAMHRHGLAAHIRAIAGGPGEEDGQRAMTEVLRNGPPPSAVAAFNDHCAIGVLDALGRAGLAVPHQVSVVGYDDSPVSRLVNISLTTVNQQASAQADWAVRAMVELLDDHRTQDRRSVLPPRLVVRGSTGPA